MNIGDLTTRTVTFTDSDGDPANPTAVAATLLAPDGTETSPTIANGGVGIRSVDVTPTMAGTYALHWVGTGAIVSAEWDVFTVDPDYAVDPLNVITLAEAAYAIGYTVGSSSEKDAVLASYATAVSRTLDDIAGPVVVRTITAEVHDGNYGVVRPRYTPISSLTTVTEYSNTTATTLTAESNTVKPASGYLLINDGPHNVRIMRRSANGDAAFATGASNVVLTYVAGRYATTAAVDAKFKEAASIMLAQLWRGEQGSGNVTFGGVETPSGGVIPTFAVPNAVRQLLGRELIAAVPFVA